MAQFIDKNKHRHYFSVAPMMGWTCPHGRYLMRILAPHARLYSEMLVDQSLIHGPIARLLAHHACEFPLAIQLASAKPDLLRQAISILQNHTQSTSIAEINLNVGCPSPRVQAGGFGACLMKDPELLFALIEVMVETSQRPTSVKLRLGVDDHVGYDRFLTLIDGIAIRGCTHIIVHARNAWLKGVNPKKNRSLPPLDYDAVHRLKQERPDLTVILNGGITHVQHCLDHLRHVDGVMIGRAAFQQPYMLSTLEQHLFGTPIPTPHQIIAQILPYWETQLQSNARPTELFRSAMYLLHGVSGAKRWRQTLAENANQKTPNLEAIQRMIDTLTSQAA